MYKKLMELNKADDPDLEEQPAWEDSFMMLILWFIWNGDETCLMAMLGDLTIAGDAEIKKHEKNTNDSRESVTMAGCCHNS